MIDLDKITKYTSNPIVLAIALFVVIDILLLISLIICDVVSRWKIFFCLSALLAILIPVGIVVYEASKRSKQEIVGGMYTSPPVNYYGEEIDDLNDIFDD